MSTIEGYQKHPLLSFLLTLLGIVAAGFVLFVIGLFVFLSTTDI